MDGNNQTIYANAVQLNRTVVDLLANHSQSYS